MPFVNRDKLKHMFGIDRAKATRELMEHAENGRLKIDDISIRDVFEASVENGSEFLDLLSYRKRGGTARMIQEAAGAVDTSSFANVIGQFVYNKIREAYDSPEFLWHSLCTTQTTQFLDGERIPGVGGIGDKAGIVEEGAEYPDVGLNEQWTDTVRTLKRGFKLPVTREILVADRTGLVSQMAAQGGWSMGLNKEKRVLDLATGAVSNYNRNGVSTNTYLTSGAYVNSITGNALSGAGNEWLALQTLELLFVAITDPNTGEPINVNPTQLLVPRALLHTANRIVGATEVQTVDMRANATTIRTNGPNPYAGGGIKVLSNSWVSLRSGSTTKWWWGDFTKALLYMQVWDTEITQAASLSEPEFARDIFMYYKASERGVAQVYEPRFVAQSDT